METIVRLILSRRRIRFMLISLAVVLLLAGLISFLFQLLSCIHLLFSLQILGFVISMAPMTLYATVVFAFGLFFLIVADNIAPIWDED